MIFHYPNNEFDLDDAEAKLVSLMKSPHAMEGCELLQHRVDKAVICNPKRSWTFICSHGKVMRNFDESHFALDSVGKINVTYQNAIRKKAKESIKGIFYVERIWVMLVVLLFEFIYIYFSFTLS
jgi:hypothetical protein